MGAVNVHLLIKFTQAGRLLILSETSEGIRKYCSIPFYQCPYRAPMEPPRVFCKSQLLSPSKWQFSSLTISFLCTKHCLTGGSVVFIKPSSSGIQVALGPSFRSITRFTWYLNSLSVQVCIERCMLQYVLVFLYLLLRKQ